MKHQLRILGFILLGSLLCVPVGFAQIIQTTGERESQEKVDNPSSSVTQEELQEILNDLVAQVPQELLSSYSGEEISDMLISLIPCVTEKISEEQVQEIVCKIVEIIKKGGIPELPDLSEEVLEQIPTSIIQEIKIFLTQVLPLYIYQMKDRSTPEFISKGDLSLSSIYDAPRDGCYYGIGDPRNTYDPKGIDCESCKQTGGRVKTNGSYVWGMVPYKGRIYWSTNNNYLCMPGYGSIATTGGSGPSENSCWVCEYEKGQRGKESNQYGDIMPPRIFVYNPQTGVVEDITPDSEKNSDLLAKSQGLRSAAAHKGVVFFGGPSFAGGTSTSSQGSTFFAYSPQLRKFIGQSDMSSISGCRVTNVRRWIIVDDVLYCGVGIIDPSGISKGAVLRWNGSINKPFDFEIVGYTTGEAAELEYHKGYIYVGGWPANGISTSAIYRSPRLSKDGLRAKDAEEWEEIWRYTDYEANPTSAGSTYFSVMKSYKGRLYWGMFSGTYGVVYAAYSKFGRIDSAEAIAYILGSLRSTTLFSSENFNSKDDVEMLYGEAKLPVYDSKAKTWAIEPNHSGYTAKWGRSGYGNLFTCYTWAMSIYNDKLYIGTMDMADLTEPAFEGSDFASASILLKLLGVKKEKYGYECLVLDDPNKAPVYVTDNGFGNPAAYGIRNLAVCGKQLFIGTANPFNLHEQGGWQILALTDHDATPLPDDEDEDTDIVEPEDPIVPDDSEDPTGMEKIGEAKEAGILFKQSASYVEFSSLKNEKLTQLTVTDMSGRTVWTDSPNAVSTVVVTHGFAAGIYNANVVTSSGTWSVKFIVTSN